MLIVESTKAFIWTIFWLGIPINQLWSNLGRSIISENIWFCFESVTISWIHYRKLHGAFDKNSLLSIDHSDTVGNCPKIANGKILDSAIHSLGICDNPYPISLTMWNDKFYWCIVMAIPESWNYKEPCTESKVEAIIPRIQF